MNIKKIAKSLKELKDIEIQTIHLFISKLGLNFTDLQKLKIINEPLYLKIKENCELKLATIYEKIIKTPRNSQTLLQLAQKQEEYLKAIFPENDSSGYITPHISIKVNEGINSLNIEELTK